MEKITRITIENIEDYIVCPARALMNMTLKDKPAKQIILSNARRGLYDVILASLGKEHLDQMVINKVIDHITTSPGYTESDYDISYLTELFASLDNLLITNEYTLTGGVMPFEYTYAGIIVQSAIDFVVKDEKRGYITPVILDFTRTRYEPFYNPIVYRCQTVVSHMDLKNRNTEVVVLSPYGKSKRWVYEKSKMAHTVTTSMEEICISMSRDLFYHRIGWWCAGCPYRGICHKIMKDIMK